MKKILLTSTLTMGLALGLAGASQDLAFADPIEGMWKTDDNVLIKISDCGGGYCVDVADGKYKGKRSGKLKSQGGNLYSGKLKQFSSGVTFTGEATLNGGSLSLAAKVFGAVVKRQTWRRQ